MSSIRILLIEDDPDISDLLQAALEPTFECLRATNGLEGLQMALAGQPDLIISDIMMPIMDGYEFIRRIRKEPQFANTPVIFLSALGTREKIRAGYELGAALYLTKPVDPVRMRRNVELFIEDHGVTASQKSRTVREVQEAFSQAHQEAAPGEAAPASVASPDPTPASPASKPAAGAPPAQKREESQRRARIMIVEEDHHSIERLRDEFARDYEVVQAFDGIEAIERAVKYEPDIFIIDGTLPKMTGYQLVTMLKRNKVFRDRPIVMVSAKTSNRDRQYIEKLGVRHLLPKPFDPADIRKAIEDIAQNPDFQVAEKRISDKQMGLETLRDFETRR
jgi:DNA-binding response OmpR family regulator